MTNRQEAVQWSREEIIWLAGLFEGEGCISHAGPAPSSPHKDQWQLRIVSVDEDVIRSVMRVAQLGYVAGPMTRDHKPVWVWGCSARSDVYALLAALWPWLHARRRERALQCLRALGARRTWERVQTRCRNGHDLTLPDAWLISGSRRRCRQCARNSGNAYTARKRVA